MSTIGKKIGETACKQSIRVGDAQKSSLTDEDTPWGIPANRKYERGFSKRSSTIVAKQGVRSKEAALIPALMVRFVGRSQRGPVWRSRSDGRNDPDDGAKGSGNDWERWHAEAQ